MSIYRNFNQEELDREYSPSSCIGDIDVYIKRYIDVSADARSDGSSSVLLDLSYGDNSDEALDFFKPICNDASRTNNKPLQVYIHGGYWQELSKNESCFAAPMFQRKGSAFAAINYSLAPNATLTEIVEQNRAAIAWLYHNSKKLEFNSEEIYLSGSSAGAHLAIMMLLTDWSQYQLPNDVIKGVCAVSGIYDLEPVRLSYVNEPLKMDKVEAYKNSPIYQEILNKCPIILAYGDNETSEFKRQTDEFSEYLESQGFVFKKSKKNEIKDCNHFDVIMELCSEDTVLSKLILEQMNLTV